MKVVRPSIEVDLMAMDLFGDLVIVIPGILGSRLVRREGSRKVTVWDFSIKNLPRLLMELATDSLVFDEQAKPPDDGVEAVGLFNYQLLPGFFGVDDYRPLIESLGAAVSDPRQLLTFPYDWRASNRFAAQRLESYALNALQQWKEVSGNKSAKLWLVCHSMGGLVARYFCEYLGGAPYTRVIITIGTPHRGSLKALDVLVNGKKFGPLDLTRMVRSLPSVYELLPLFPAVRVESGDKSALHRVADFFGLDPVSGRDSTIAQTANAANNLAPLANLDRGMLKRALEFHARIREPAEARTLKGEPTLYRQEAFFNRRQLTPLSARLNGHTLDILNTYPYERNGVVHEMVERGDGKVPSFSSVPIEWSDTRAAIAVADKHAAMQSAINVRDTIINWLRPMDVRAKKGGSSDDRSVVELNAPATLQSDEELVVRGAALQPMNVMVWLEHMEKGWKKTQPMGLPGDNIYGQATFRRLDPGVYRVTAVPADRMAPTVSDYVFVIDPAWG